MKCELFFSYEKNIDFENIKKHLEGFPEQNQIITDNYNLHKFLKKNKINSKMMGELIPDDGNLAKEIFEKAKNLQEGYRKAFSKLTYKKISIFSGFDNLLFRQLIILFKAEKILQNKRDTIFIFKEYFPIFFVIKKRANEMGYNTIPTIGIIEKNKIGTLNITNTEKLQTKLSQKRSYNFLKNSIGKNFSLKSCKIIFTAFIDITGMMTKKMTYNLLNYVKINSNERLMEKICKKTKSQPNLKVLFFVTTGREDLYLKPWNPVLKLLGKSSIIYQIFTNDLATSNIITIVPIIV